MGKLTVWLMMSSWSASFGGWWHNSLGSAFLSKGDKVRAYKEFNRAILADPLNPILQINLGLTFEANEEAEKAEATYRGILEYSDRKRRVPTNILDFNLGNALAAQRKVPEALASYQAALDDHHVDPPDDDVWGHVQFYVGPREVKKNIELLFAKGGGQGEGKGRSDQNDPDQKPKDGQDQDKDKKNQKKDDKTNQQKREESLEKPQPDQQKDKDKGKKTKPFQSQELGPDDVKRILDEIKNQEQNIRAQEYDKKPKDGARGGKDW